jgi:epsin
MHILFV